MKTFVFYCKYSEASIILSATDEQEAFKELGDIVILPNHFRLGEVMNEEQTLTNQYY